MSEQNQVQNQSQNKSKTIDELYDEIDFGFYHYRAALIIGGSLFCEYMESSLLSLIQSCVVTSFHDQSTIDESLLTGSVFMGEILGMLFLGPLADTFGRKNILLFSWITILIFGLLACISPNLWFLIVTRFLVGIGIGSSQAVAFDLFTELLPKKYRSRALFVNFIGGFGQLYLILCSFLTLNTYGWRVLMLFAAIPSILLVFVGFMYLDESPRWLLSQGRVIEAENIIKNMAINNNKYNINIILKSLHKSNNHSNSTHENTLLIHHNPLNTQNTHTNSPQNNSENTQLTHITSPTSQNPQSIDCCNSLTHVFTTQIITYEKLIEPSYLFTTIVLWLLWFCSSFLFLSLYLIFFNFARTKESECNYNYNLIILAATVLFIG